MDTARLISRLTLEAKRLQLEVRRRRGGANDLFVDYGWAKLIYTADSDAQELYYHLHQERWHEKDIHVFRNLLAPGETAVDVGANSGFVSAMFASIVGPEGRVLALEPAPETFAKLKKTIEANAFRQVVPLNIGCGASSSVVKLNRVSRSSGNASIVASGTDSIDIRIEPLDDIEEVWETRIALLKIDTEGYEPEVLRGAQRLLAEHRPVIYLEMGGDYVASTRQTIQLLEDAGYGVEHVRTIDWSEVGSGSDYFFLPGK